MRKAASVMNDAGPTIAERLLRWFDAHGRHDLPWQHPRTPYRVWLSEVMLQQTQVRVAIPFFERFVAALPDVPALAAASQDEVLALWSGLGYYTRARNLHAAAQACMQRHGGELPRNIDALIALPGIGRNTAGAILAQAWGEPVAILDGNVKRVLARLHGVEGWPGKPSVERKLWALAEAQLPDKPLPAARMADFVQAQMDFGATLCTRHDPACTHCPLRDDCIALQTGRVSELPTPKPGKALPSRSAVVLWVCNGEGRVLLQRRPPVGVWASLWSLPEAEDCEAARAWFDAHLLASATIAAFDNAQVCEPIAHAFSHYRLQLHPLHWRPVALRSRVADNDDLRWVARAELASLGIPAPIRKLIEIDPAQLKD